VVKTLFLLGSIVFSIISGFAQQVKQYVFSHFSTEDGLASNIVNNVVQDDKGFTWLAAIDGLQRYDGNKFITFKTKSSNSSTTKRKMMQRAQVIGADLDIQSEKNGVSIILVVPVKN